MIAQWIGSVDPSPAKACRCGNIPTSTPDVPGGNKMRTFAVVTIRRKLLLPKSLNGTMNGDGHAPRRLPCTRYYAYFKNGYPRSKADCRRSLSLMRRSLVRSPP
jgi:hypothetical protein